MFITENLSPTMRKWGKVLRHLENFKICNARIQNGKRFNRDCGGKIFFLYISFLVGQFGGNKIHYEDK